MRFKRYLEAGRVPASLLMGLWLLAGCGAQVPNSTVATGLTLDCQTFQSQVAGVGVNRIFDLNISGNTCSASNCHSISANPPSPGKRFKIYPNALPNSPEMATNYNNVVANFATNYSNPVDNLILRKPLSSSQPNSDGHGGGDIFPNASDPNYVTILAWISNPVPRPSTCP